MDAILEQFGEYLALERGRSDHTRRAYLGDLRSLFDFMAERAPGRGLDGLSLPLLRELLHRVGLSVDRLWPRSE